MFLKQMLSTPKMHPYTCILAKITHQKWHYLK